MPKISKKTGMALGWGGALLMGGLLAFLHLGAKVEVPRIADPLPGAKPVYVCKGAPSWVKQEMAPAKRFWTRHGAKYGAVWFDADCPPDCKVTDPVSGRVRLLPCREGAITVDLQDQGFSDDHVSETVLGTHRGEPYRTILVPSVIDGAVSHEGGELLVEDVPDDVYQLVLAHELGHAEGYGHSQTKGTGGTIHKRGELMHPFTYGLGFGDGGLP
jgi:hypothetical protein